MRTFQLFMGVVAAMCCAMVASAQSRDVVVECEWGSISATIDMAAESNGTAILIVAGSGPTDRNGNSAAGLNTFCYKMLGEELAEGGYVVMR